MNKMAIYTRIILRPHNAMFSLSNITSLRIGNDNVIVILYG